MSTQIIALTVYTRNEKTPASTTLGMDINDIVVPIRFNSTAGKSYFTTRLLRDVKSAGGSENNARVEYVVNENLAAIVSQSDDLVLLTVDSIDDRTLSANGLPVASEQMIFDIRRIIEGLIPGTAMLGGTYFFYHEDGYPLPRKYHVTQSIAQIIAASTPPAPTPSIPIYGIVRAVYLVNDAADATALGGASNNVYSSFQAAYNKANTLSTALSAIVPIIVGNTTAIGVGDVTLAASWNPNVHIHGLNKNDSIVGNITASGTMSISLTANNVRISNITTDGQPIALTLRNALAGNIVASSGTTASGAVSFTNCYDAIVGTINSDASAGNTSGVTFTSCNDVTTGAISTINTSGTGSYSITALSIISCNDLTIAGYTATMSNATSTGSVGGMICGITNTNIVFSAPVIIQGYTNSTGATSDVSVSQITLWNVTFNGNFLINGRNVAGDTPTGGYVASLFLDNCVFNGARNKLFFNTTNAKTVNNYFIRNCKFFNVGLNVFIYNVQFSLMQVVNNYFKDTSVGYHINASTSPLSLSTGASSFIIYNMKGQGSILLQFVGDGFGNDTFDIKDVEMDEIAFNIYGGSGNINAKSCTATFTLLDTAGLNTSRHVLKNCHGEIISDGSPIFDCYQSHLTINNGVNIDAIAYGSTLNVYGSGGATINGTLNTCTITRQNTSTLSATMNNSYDESLP